MAGYNLDTETPDHSTKPEAYYILFSKKSDDGEDIDAIAGVLKDVFKVSSDNEAQEVIAKVNPAGVSLILCAGTKEVIDEKIDQLKNRLGKDATKGVNHTNVQFEYRPESALKLMP